MERKLWDFKPEKAVLLVIDMQNDFVLEGAPMEVEMARKFVPNMKKLVETCRENDIPVIFTQHVLSDQGEISPLEVTYLPQLKEQGLRPGTEGVEIISELEPLVNEQVIVKHRYDSFYNTRLETVVRNARKTFDTDTIIITGTVTNACCESTARGAYMRDFKVVFVNDANGGFDEQSHEATLRSIDKLLGRVLSTDEIVQQIQANHVNA